MDEYLSEKEQIERLRHWWSDYGWYVIAGIAIGGASLFGLFRYQDSVRASAENASALYSELAAASQDDDRARVEALLTTLRSEHAGSPYTDNGALLLARMVLVSDPQRAISELRNVMDTTVDSEIATIARLRLARVLAWQSQYDEALALLDIDSAGPFAARVSDIRGDVLQASGDTDGALAAWTTALLSPGSDALDRNYLQMKASNLLVAEAAPEAAAPGTMAPVSVAPLQSTQEETPAENVSEESVVDETVADDSAAQTADGSAP